MRSLHAQNQPVQQAQAGQRCAVALAGIDKDAVHRGDWLVDSAVALATDRFDVTLTLWKDEEKPLRSGARVQVHLGAASVPGTVALLDAEQLPPGGTAKAQIITRTPLGAPGMATAWCCATPRPRAPWRAGRYSIRVLRCATVVRRSGWHCWRLYSSHRSLLGYLNIQK